MGNWGKKPVCGKSGLGFANRPPRVCVRVAAALFPFFLFGSKSGLPKTKGGRRGKLVAFWWGGWVHGRKQVWGEMAAVWCSKRTRCRNFPSSSFLPFPLLYFPDGEKEKKFFLGSRAVPHLTATTTEIWQTWINFFLNLNLNFQLPHLIFHSTVGNYLEWLLVLIFSWKSHVSDRAGRNSEEDQRRTYSFGPSFPLLTDYIPFYSPPPPPPLSSSDEKRNGEINHPGGRKKGGKRRRRVSGGVDESNKVHPTVSRNSTSRKEKKSRNLNFYFLFFPVLQFGNSRSVSAPWKLSLFFPTFISTLRCSLFLFFSSAAAAASTLILASHDCPQKKIKSGGKNNTRFPKYFAAESRNLSLRLDGNKRRIHSFIFISVGAGGSWSGKCYSCCCWGLILLSNNNNKINAAGQWTGPARSCLWDGASLHRWQQKCRKKVMGKEKNPLR